MRRFISALLPALAFLTAPCAEGKDSAWLLTSRCDAPKRVELQVRLDGARVFAVTLPLCEGERGDKTDQVSFKFTPDRAITWYGYRSDGGDGSKDVGEATPAGSPLEVQLWQAGGESNAIELGYTVSGSDGLHMNSVHILLPNRSSKTIMAPGLTLETRPVGKP